MVGAVGQAVRHAALLGAIVAASHNAIGLEGLPSRRRVAAVWQWQMERSEDMCGNEKKRGRATLLEKGSWRLREQGTFCWAIPQPLPQEAQQEFRSSAEMWGVWRPELWMQMRSVWKNVEFKAGKQWRKQEGQGEAMAEGDLGRREKSAR